MTDPEPTPEKIAEIRNTLTRLEKGDSAAADEMFPIVYDELRRLAGSRMKRERINHTLRPTALVNEAYAKISGQADASVKSKTHFVAIASLAMQRILTDHARSHKAEKRGGGRKRDQLHENNQVKDEGAVDQTVLEEIAQSVERLAQVDERKATVVRLRMLGGMSVPEVAEVLGIASSTVSSDWKVAKDWIAQELGLEL
ncbi:MAG: ECF-type sigma factor [Phycisphaerales bacterium]|nr:ECF-type sigma factor [Phycisphaerales bacterium]